MSGSEALLCQWIPEEPPQEVKKALRRLSACSSLAHIAHSGGVLPLPLAASAIFGEATPIPPLRKASGEGPPSERLCAFPRPGIAISDIVKRLRL